MADSMQDFSAANQFLNPVSLMPSGGEFDLAPGSHSLFGNALAQDKAGAAQQFINAQLKRLPQENQLRMMETDAQIGRFPLEEQQRAEKLRQEYSELKGKPTGQFVNEAADLYGTPDWEKKSPEEKAQSYGALANTWKARHPGLELPQGLDQYQGQSTEQHLKDAYDMRRYSVAHKQKLEEETLKGKYSVAAQRGRGVEAEEIRAQELRDRERNEKTMKDKEILKLNRILTDPKSSEDDKSLAEAQLERIVEPLIDDKVTKRWGNETSALYLSPERQAMRTKMIEAETAKMRKSYGLDRRGPKPGGGNPTDRVNVVGPDGKAGTIPRHQLEQAKAQGYKEQ
jgi:hypothetical protein